MPLQISCPSCSAKLHAPETLLGTAVRCPSCQNTFTAEAPAPAPPLSAPLDDKAVQTEPSVPPSQRHLPDYEEDEDYPRRLFGRGNYVPARGGIWLGLGIASVVVAPLGICLQPFIFGCISLALGLTALIMGGRDLKRIRGGEMDPDGENLTKAGWILGIIGTIVGGLLTFCGAAHIIFVIVMVITGGFK